MRTRSVQFLFFLLQLFFTHSNLFFSIPEGCCIKKQQRITDQHSPRYKVVEGEIFMMPCYPSVKSPMKWFKGDEGKECGKEFVAEENSTGAYRNLSGSNLTLQIIKKSSLRCFQPSESNVLLVVGKGGTIRCPGHTCYSNTGVVWYKRNKPVSELNRKYCQDEEKLYPCEVYKEDTGVYYCDRQITEKGVTWTLRRAVNVTVIANLAASSPPLLQYPPTNLTEEVQLGQPYTLMCKVMFDFEVNKTRKVQWFMNYSGDMRNMTLLDMEPTEESQTVIQWFDVTQKSIIKEVTPHHLEHSYTCFASNTKGNSSVTIRLKKKIQVKWPSLVGYPFACLLPVAAVGIILYVKWLEVRLICRSHFKHGKFDEDEKEFDVFVSYVWTLQSAEDTNGLTLSYKPYSDAEGCISTVNTQSSDRPIEMLLPQVLEDQWGYRVCLLERDILPGGAYTNDVVLTINRSRMLICVLSAEYFASSNAVFVLESGVKALLQRSALEILLIWTSGTSASFIQPEPPLPKLVQRALKVLPSLHWSTDTSSPANRSFWLSLQKAMPVHGAKVPSPMQ